VSDQHSCGHLKTGERTVSFKAQSSTSERDRDYRKIAQEVKMIIVLQVGRDRVTEKNYPKLFLLSSYAQTISANSATFEEF